MRAVMPHVQQARRMACRAVANIWIWAAMEGRHARSRAGTSPAQSRCGARACPGSGCIRHRGSVMDTALGNDIQTKSYLPLYHAAVFLKISILLRRDAGPPALETFGRPYSGCN